MIILLPTVDKEWEDLVYPYLAFCYRMKYKKREWTGYKEIQSIGLDADWLLSLGIIAGPTKSGGYRFVEENIVNLVNIYTNIAPEEYLTSDELWNTEIDWKSFLSVDYIGNGIMTFPNGLITVGRIPEGVDINKWISNELIADTLKNADSSIHFDNFGIKRLSDFDFDVVLYDNLPNRIQNNFLRHREMAMSDLDYYSCYRSQDKLEDYAEQYVKKCIKDGTYDSLSDYLKRWFSDKIKESKKKGKYWGDYICDQTNKPEE